MIMKNLSITHEVKKKLLPSHVHSLCISVEAYYHRYRERLHQLYNASVPTETRICKREAFVMSLGAKKIGQGKNRSVKN